jgi:tight adherence protein C
MMTSPALHILSATAVSALALRRAFVAAPFHHRLRTARSGPRWRSGLPIRVGTAEVTVPLWWFGAITVPALLSPLCSLAVALVLLARVVGGPRRAERIRLRVWQSTVPDLVELVRLALFSGCTTHLTLRLIAQHAGGAVSEMLDRTAASLREGASTSQAIADLQTRVGAPIRPLCAALLGSERYGLPLTATLEALAVEARLSRQRDAEMRSRRLPVLLIFPLVVCILPAFALLTVVPLLGGGLSSLSW